MAVSGSQNLVFPAILTSALQAEAAAELISLPGAADDPKLSFPIAKSGVFSFLTTNIGAKS